MLLKWIFTLLGILWLIQALRPYLTGSEERERERPRYTPPPPPDPAPPPAERKAEAPRHKNIDDEYIDYEEIK